MPKPTMCDKCKVKRASFGFEGGKRTRCAACRDGDMKDLMSKKCEKCKVVCATYGFPGKKYTHCVSCKTDDMENVKAPRCQGCKKKQPFFGLDKTKPATHCADCRTGEMFNVRSRMCRGCDKVLPSFGLPNGKATHCGTCSTPEMICRNRKCEKCNETQPTFGYEGQRPTRCAACRDGDMKDLVTKKCIVCNKTAAAYGFEGEEYKHCAACAQPGMINTKHKKRRCKQGTCASRGNEKYRGYCTHCFQHLFPNDSLCLEMHNKTYETAVRNVLIENKLDFIHDKPIYHSGCDCASRRRIDFWKMIGNTILAIEVDENQHSGYDKKDEEIRYDDLFMHFSGKWVFIRFNPNTYKRDGILYNPKMHERTPQLLKTIQKHIERIQKEENKELVEIHHLFFNRA
jgi:hypothetical protein